MKPEEQKINNTIEEITAKEDFNWVVDLKEEARGIGLKIGTTFILKEEGEEGLKRLEDIMLKLGYPIRYKEIKSMSFYPLKLLYLTFIVSQKVFNYDDKKFQKIGKFESKFPLFIRLYMKYFVSLKKLKKAAPRIWRNHYMSGSFKVTEINREKRYIIARIEDFPLHPYHFQFLLGFFPSMLKIIIRKEATCEGKECPGSEGKCHEFVMRWQE